MKPIKPVVFIRKFHRWLGLLIGLQVLLWVSGGLVMSFFDIEKVRGENNIAKSSSPKFIQEVKYSASDLLAALDFKAKKVQLGYWQGILVWRVEGDGQNATVDAQTGEVLSPFNQEQVTKVALSDWAGEGVIVASELTTDEHYEIRGRELPLWRFQFNDSDNTRIYVSPKTGDVVARRNDTWRLFDFFWMLHIMDYKGRDDFNHPLLIIAALLGLLFSITGVYLVIKTVFLRRKRRV